MATTLRSVAVASLQLSNNHLTQSGLRIGGNRETDDAWSALDDGNQCYLALPFVDPNHALSYLLFASIACCTLATLAHLLADLSRPTGPVATKLMPLWFLGSATCFQVVGSCGGGVLTRSPPFHPCRGTRPEILTKGDNLRIKPIFAQSHQYKTHTGCWNESGPYCSAPSSSQ